LGGSTHHQCVSDKNKKLRVAIAGAGIGAEHLAGYLDNPDLYEVCYICDPDRHRAQTLIDRCAALYLPDYIDALQRPELDVLDICLPPGLHKEAILNAIDADKHVVCEKPLVKSLADIDEIIGRVQASSSQLVPVFQYRFGNGIGKLCHLIESGITGPALVATLETHWNRDADYYSVAWRGQWATELGGAIVGHAIHAHDLLVQVLGPVASVQARLATRVNEIAVEDCAAIGFTLESGALANSSITLGCANDHSRLRFCFANLTAESSLDPYNPGTDPWTFVARGDGLQPTIDAALSSYPPHKEGFARQFELAHASFVHGAIAPVTLDDARASLELITAIYQSSRTARFVDLPLDANAKLYAGWLPD